MTSPSDERIRTPEYYILLSRLNVGILQRLSHDPLSYDAVVREQIRKQVHRLQDLYMHMPRTRAHTPDIDGFIIQLRKVLHSVKMKVMTESHINIF